MAQKHWGPLDGLSGPELDACLELRLQDVWDVTEGRWAERHPEATEAAEKRKAAWDALTEEEKAAAKEMVRVSFEETLQLLGLE